ncbi:DNA glycosylase [Coccomyxa subellipsoidea C-169]|uniref:DNA-(apurinic or apyrimidinic site) lyase n=1 Tax=Coccomyxa subellipsoidea (strain C-169) TaxID=574566 RepID=I0YUU2_COCSC|nr:DNA glycosylase [Coccomyxa subellipsoidea C-169]EIE22161.1 DNA glycosylase [Coccomyxa subellipsoidea C-169]|eukprot:XP_005646705.1 DNA glycosylase [Coccomyxa subellipsoidea C-169]
MASVGCRSTACHIVKVPAPTGFDLATAVSSYGFFMLAPNRWVKAVSSVPGSQPAFERPLRTADDTAVPVRITQSILEDGSELSVAVETTDPLSTSDEQHLQSQVVRMLSLAPADVEVVAALQRMHAEAKAASFGHMFRSPTLWEDMVKSITLCNCGWGRTISMNAALCSEIGGGAFPTPAQVAAAGVEALQSRCGVGYRGKTIHGLAQQFLDGTVSGLALEEPGMDASALYKKLLPLSGMGPFTAANVLQLLGHFERIPADTETARHLKHRHKLSGLSPRTLQEAAQKVYEKYAPYQFLVYWFELRQGYEDLFGSLADMDPDDYAKATGHIMRAGAAAAASGAAVAKGPEIPQLAAAVAAETSNTVAPIDVIIIPLSEGNGGERKAKGVREREVKLLQTRLQGEMV